MIERRYEFFGSYLRVHSRGRGRKSTDIKYDNIRLSPRPRRTRAGDSFRFKISVINMIGVSRTSWKLSNRIFGKSEINLYNLVERRPMHLNNLFSLDFFLRSEKATSSSYRCSDSCALMHPMAALCPTIHQKRTSWFRQTSGPKISEIVPAPSKNPTAICQDSHKVSR